MPLIILSILFEYFQSNLLLTPVLVDIIVIRLKRLGSKTVLPPSLIPKSLYNLLNKLIMFVVSTDAPLTTKVVGAFGFKPVPALITLSNWAWLPVKLFAPENPVPEGNWIVAGSTKSTPVPVNTFCIDSSNVVVRLAPPMFIVVGLLTFIPVPATNWFIFVNNTWLPLKRSSSVPTPVSVCKRWICDNKLTAKSSAEAFTPALWNILLNNSTIVVSPITLLSTVIDLCKLILKPVPSNNLLTKLKMLFSWGVPIFKPTSDVICSTCSFNVLPLTLSSAASFRPRFEVTWPTLSSNTSSLAKKSVTSVNIAATSTVFTALNKVSKSDIRFAKESSCV